MSITWRHDSRHWHNALTPSDAPTGRSSNPLCSNLRHKPYGRKRGPRIGLGRRAASARDRLGPVRTQRARPGAGWLHGVGWRSRERSGASACRRHDRDGRPLHGCRTRPAGTTGDHGPPPPPAPPRPPSQMSAPPGSPGRAAACGSRCATSAAPGPRSRSTAPASSAATPSGLAAPSADRRRSASSVPVRTSVAGTISRGGDRCALCYAVSRAPGPGRGVIRGRRSTTRGTRPVRDVAGRPWPPGRGRRRPGRAGRSRPDR